MMQVVHAARAIPMAISSLNDGSQLPVTAITQTKVLVKGGCNRQAAMVSNGGSSSSHQ
jgi:hypothetical protein